jgi:glutamate racemase
MIEVLQELGATHVLIACNAASTVIDDLTTRLPVTGTIAPTLRALSRISPVEIGVIGGARTIRAGLHRRSLEAAGHTVRQRIAQPLSGHIERGTLDTPRGRDDLTRIVAPLRGIHTLVLACTHYPAITPQLQALLPQVRMFDPAVEVARQIANQMGTAGPRTMALWCTGDAHAMREAATRAWGRDPGRCRQRPVT